MSEPESSVLVTVDGEPYGTICYAPVQADGYMDHLEGIRNGLAMDVGTEVAIDKLEGDGKGGYRLHLDVRCGEGEGPPVRHAVAHIPSGKPDKAKK